LTKNIINHPDNNGIIFDELLDLSDDLIFMLDPGGNFTRVNKLGALNLEYEPSELKGKHLFTIIDKQCYTSATNNLGKLLSGTNMLKFDVIFCSRLGTSIDYNLTLKSIFREEKLTGVGGIAKNISVRHRSQSKIAELEIKLIESMRMISIERARWKQDKSVLEELNRLKNEFVSNISHELPTPLASIIGFSETILSDPEMSPELRDEFNSIILTEGKRLAQLINHILEISRMESGKVLLIMSDIEMKSLLKEAIDVNLSFIQRKDLNFTFEFPEEEVIIKGDKEKLLGVFEGLINNAAKFTAPGGRIKVMLNNISSEAEVIISDTGKGISEKDQSQIFQKYYTNTDSVDISKSGFGLVFVKQIIDLHRGLILVHSEVNKGTTFVVKLPYQNKTEGNT
jgi:PAS domain S-box-containing protein